MADSFVKNISALFLQGFEIGFKKTLERGKYMKKENGVTKQVGKKLNLLLFRGKLVTKEPMV